MERLEISSLLKITGYLAAYHAFYIAEVNRIKPWHSLSYRPRPLFSQCYLCAACLPYLFSSLQRARVGAHLFSTLVSEAYWALYSTFLLLIRNLSPFSIYHSTFAQFQNQQGADGEDNFQRLTCSVKPHAKFTDMMQKLKKTTHKAVIV